MYLMENGGNVGIGTVSPTSLLTVDGGITAISLDASAYNFADATAVAGTADAITMDFTPNLSALAAGLEVKFVAEGANTGAATLTIDGGDTKNIYESSDISALEAGDIANSAVVHLIYDGTQWQQVSQSGN